MSDILIILFLLTLFYISIAERFKIYAQLIGLQGILLFGISFTTLSSVNLVSFAFAISETLIFKGIVVPYFLNRIVKKTLDTKVHQRAMPGFYSLLLAIAGLFISILLGFSIKGNELDHFSFIVSLFSLYTGLVLIIGHKKIYSHLIGFLIIENAVFLFSIAVGSEMPMLINIGILLDIFVSVLILSVFLTKIDEQMNDLGSESLSNLKG